MPPWRYSGWDARTRSGPCSNTGPTRERAATSFTAFDLSTQTVIDAIGDSALSSPWVAAKLQRIARDEYSAEFSLSLALKDVNLALDSIDPSLHAVLRSLAAQWRDAAQHGLGDEDLTVITRFLERRD